MYKPIKFHMENFCRYKLPADCYEGRVGGGDGRQTSRKKVELFDTQFCVPKHFLFHYSCN
jgi:hypothetical protein